MVGDQHAVSFPERVGMDNRIDPKSGVGNQDQVFGQAAHEGGQSATALCDSRRQVPCKEANRLRCKTFPKSGLVLLHGLWDGSERTVVQEDEIFVECPVFAELGMHPVILTFGQPGESLDGYQKYFPITGLAR